MKLFQRLLVAPAALGLMAPVAVNADTFSSTTSLGGSAFFTVGSVENGTGSSNEELYMQYAYGLDMTSSFTGEDALYIGMEAGNAGTETNGADPLSGMDSSVNTSSNAVTVHSAFYTFPVGDLAVLAGPLVDQDDVVGATTSKYSDAFRLGSMPYSLNGAETGPGVGVTWSNDSGVVLSGSFVADDGDNSAKGINADTGNDVTTLTLGYNGDGFGGGIIIASHDGDVVDSDGNATGYDTFGIGGYYTPESIPATISIAYDSKDPVYGSDATDLFIGVDYEVGPGTLHLAWNSSEVDDNSDNTDSTGFELAYSYAINDNVTITPGFFTVEETTSTDEDSGVVLETAFSF